MNNEKIAAYFQKLDENRVECVLCPHNCIIDEGKRGICGVRENNEGDLYSLNYGYISSIGSDPIEKKPLYHFYPGQDILSIGTYGCNFNCEFCQNWRISQKEPVLKKISPEEIVRMAEEKNMMGIAYTYSEPSVWFEYVLATSKLAHKHNLKNVLVTNGFIQQTPLKELLPYIDAANVDLKSIDDEFYQKLCGGRMEPVVENIKLMENKIHLEATSLLITDYNDNKENIEELFSLLADINSDLPLHISRYFPNYEMDTPPTPLSRMEAAYKLAQKYLNYVYLGNVRLQNVQNTECPECGKNIINRNMYQIKNKLQGNKCPECGKKIYGKFA